MHINSLANMSFIDPTILLEKYQKQQQQNTATDRVQTTRRFYYYILLHIIQSSKYDENCQQIQIHAMHTK